MALGLRNILLRFKGDAAPLDKTAKQGEKAISGWASGVAKAGAMAAAAAATAALAIGAAIAGGIRDTLAKSKSDALLAAQLGASGPQAAAAGAAAGRLYARGVVESVEEANAAIRAAIQNGLVTKDAGKEAIDAIGARVANLAKVMEDDASRVSAAVRTMLETGMASSAEDAFDLLQRSTELGINKQGDLLDTMTEYSVLFRNLGIDGPQALGLINQAMAAGARDSDKAADALKEFNIRAVDGSKLSADGFRALGLDAGKMATSIGKGGTDAAAALDLTLDRLAGIKDPVKQSQTAVALFGTQAEDLGKALYAMDLTTATAGLGDIAGAAGKAGDALENNLGTKVDSAGRKLKQGVVDGLGKVIEFAEKHRDKFEAIGSVFVKAGDKVRGFWTENVQPQIAKFVPTLDKLKDSAKSVGEKIIPAVKKAFEDVKKSIDDNKPAIDEWTERIKTVANFIVEKVVPVLGPLIGTFIEIVGKAIGLFIKFGTKVTENIGGIIDTLMGWRNKAIEIINAITAKGGEVRDSIKDIWSGISDNVSGAFDRVVNGVKAGVNRVVDAVNLVIAGINNSVLDAMNGVPGVNISRIPSLPRLALGGRAAHSRDYLVGEKGPEILRMGSRSGTVVPNSAIGGGPEYAEIHIHLGDEVTKVVRTEIKRSNRTLRTRVLAGAGAGI